MYRILLRYCFFSVGWLSVALGTLGIFLPILPSTPFYLLALACFAKSSPRFHRMLLNNRWVGPPLQRYLDGYGISRSAKTLAILTIVSGMGLSFYLMPAIWPAYLAMGAIGLGVSLYIISIKPRRRLEGSECPLELASALSYPRLSQTEPKLRAR